MTRAAWLGVAVLLVLPVAASSWSLAVSGAFLAEFLSDGRVPLLSALTAPPSRGPLRGPGGAPLAADLYRAPRLVRAPGLVLVHGLSPGGKDEPRLADAGRLLARAGFAVAVPTVHGLTVLRLRPEDAAPVRAAIEALWAQGHRPVAVLGISVGAGPALLGAAASADKVSAVLALGGYGSAVELLRYTLTGAYRFGDVGGRAPVDEAAVARFARENADLVDAAGRALVESRDPGALDALVDALPPGTRRLLDELSPDRALARLRAPLFLVHGRGDPAVPFTESLRLAAAAREARLPARLVVVGAVAHVEAGERAEAADLVRLAGAFHAFRAAAGRAPPTEATSAGPAP